MRRIDSKTNEADEDFESLKSKLLEREYNPTIVEAGLKKHGISRGKKHYRGL